MTHSVKSHLAVDAAAYDQEIRRFIPGYETMLTEARDALSLHFRARVAPPAVLDLGAGTGALTASLIDALPSARFTLLDVDTAMMDEAKRRLSAYSERVSFLLGSFFDPLPSCDAAIASLSLHHEHDEAKKRELYTNIHAGVLPGGILLTCDAMVSSDAVLKARTFERWAEHLERGGDTKEEARARFASWAEEDRYFSIEEEIELMRGAGFMEVDVVWRSGPLAVVIAIA